MKGKITEKGILMIGRGPSQKLKLQDCPHDIDDGLCGDRCPLFGEPTSGMSKNKTTLLICQERLLWFDEFTDERE